MEEAMVELVKYDSDQRDKLKKNIVILRRWKNE